MIESPSRQQRQLVPRWRSLSRTVASRELGSLSGKLEHASQDFVSRDLVERLERWRTDPGIINAAEVVESALVHAQEREAVNAAKYLLARESPAHLVHKHAALVLKRTGHNADVPDGINAGLQDTARLWRSRTRLHPHDSLAWVELALAQVSSGQQKRAWRSMAVALQLSPENRHVLRSAARLYLHCREHERAHDLVLRNAATPNDPWLMAAEIALAPGAGRKPAFMKKGTELLYDDRHNPRQITELAGAAGTTFLVDGNRKRGKRLFQWSMIDPTGNSLAQAEWASQAFGETLVRTQQLQGSSDAREATALYLFKKGDFETSLEVAKQWIEEEPFANRAYRFATTAANILDEYSAAEELAVAGLKHDPHSTHLLNALAFSMGNLDKLDEAELILDGVPTAGDKDSVVFVGEANRGLIAMRRGLVVQGEAHYLRAIAGFHKSGYTQMEDLAMAYFAREAALAGLSRASELLADVEVRSMKRSDPTLLRVLEAVRRNMTQVRTA